MVDLSIFSKQILNPNDCNVEKINKLPMNLCL